MVADRYPDGGALGGIFTGLAGARGDAAFPVACHMPFLSPDVMRLVLARAGEADVVIPRVDGQYETMHALYTKACLPAMETRLRAGQLKIVGFFPDVRGLEIATPPAAPHRAPQVPFMTVNTPDDLARAPRRPAQWECRRRAPAPPPPPPPPHAPQSP